MKNYYLDIKKVSATALKYFEITLLIIFSDSHINECDLVDCILKKGSAIFGRIEIFSNGSWIDHITKMQGKNLVSLMAYENHIALEHAAGRLLREITEFSFLRP